MNRSRLSHSLQVLLATAGICLLVSCGHFNSDWKQALDTPAPKHSIVGAWTGTWKSEATGHTGQLRCVVSPPANAEGDHTFLYHARWGRLFAASFTATHRVKPASDGFHFSGSHEMPSWVGGTYLYDGTVKGDAFSAAYRSSKDHGVFEMRRPN